MPKSYQGDFKIFSGDSGLWVFLGQASPRKKMPLPLQRNATTSNAAAAYTNLKPPAPRQNLKIPLITFWD